MFLTASRRGPVNFPGPPVFLSKACPLADVRLTAGRSKLSDVEQAFCFFAGANSIFSSETQTMLTKAVPSPSYDADRLLLDLLGRRCRKTFAAQQTRTKPIHEVKHAEAN